MTEFEELKINIFPGVNDISIAPTATTGSNISHMHQQFNNLIDSVISGNQELQSTINSNYIFLNNYCSTNKGLIITNTATINDNRNYHENVTNGIQTNLAVATSRIDNLETALLPQSIYEIDNVSLYPDGNNNYKYDITIPITGKLIYILLDNSFDGNDNSFDINNSAIIVSNGTSQDNNYIYAYDVNAVSQEVTQGDILTITSTNNDTAITKIQIKILPSEPPESIDQGVIDTLTDRINQLENTVTVIQNSLAGDTSEFTFDNISLTNNNGFEEYILTIPKTGSLTKIEFNNVDQLSQIFLEYETFDLETSENLGADENYPYVLDVDPPVDVNNGVNLRIYTEYVEANLTSIRLTIV